MRGANLTESSLTGAILHNADLRYSDLGKANLSKADLRQANLEVPTCAELTYEVVKRQHSSVLTCVKLIYVGPT